MDHLKKAVSLGIVVSDVTKQLWPVMLLYLEALLDLVTQKKGLIWNVYSGSWIAQCERLFSSSSFLSGLISAECDGIMLIY